VACRPDDGRGVEVTRTGRRRQRGPGAPAAHAPLPVRRSPSCRTGWRRRTLSTRLPAS